MAARRGKKRAAVVKSRAGVPPAEKLFMVRRTFPGVTYGSIPLERGRLVRLQGLAKDQQMLRLEYIEEIADPSIIDPSECGACGGEFVSMSERDGHYKREHKDILRAREQTIHELTERQRQQMLKKTGTYGPEDVGFMPESTPLDMETERIIQQEEKIAPLRLDKTKASRA